MGQSATVSQTPHEIGIVIVAHGGLARELLAAVEHVVGKLSGVRAISIDPDYDRQAKASEIRAAADAVDDGSGVVVVVDLHGSSPANLCQAVGGPAPRHILTGANVPMLLKLAQSRHQPLDAAVQAALAAGRKYIDGREVGNGEVRA
ncbi:MAG: PTS fructose transporter subunit IIA [Rhodobacterales bacterium]|uniref:PTS sugar transporter subunit IIA n=1 Tax=Gemmobacter nectariphilus TaxID=220343 RepID=UPI000686B154|nr:PTS fructose transporter subunit IIA [Gemmobacter nectariphilus]MDX5358352.1 PTS fructose transporter subunit IIA [Rhodobacterales bacterium]MDX5500576.1 PTS fructose transporter subunit IIA [Rhodobacterales bacterium]